MPRFSPSRDSPASIRSSQGIGSSGLRNWVRPREALTETKKPPGNRSRQVEKTSSFGQR
jgi:hypothetical protein